MAKKNRTCEQCGGKASPHIPRQRVNGRLLCSGCAQTESHKMTTAASSTPAGDGKAKKKPQAPGATFDFWDGELAPEGHHPLASPLPNSIWEKYAKHRALLGKDPMQQDHYQEAELRGAKPEQGNAAPFPGSRADLAEKKKQAAKTAAELHNAANFEPGPKLIQHLQDHHGLPPAPAMIQGHSILPHKNLHDAGADHTHGPNGEVVAKQQGDSGEHPHHSQMDEGQVKQHLIQQHGIPENSGSLTTGLKGMQTTHAEDHEADEQDYHQLKHTHEPAPAAPAGGKMPHAHDHEHKEFGEDGPEVLKHPAKFTNGSLHSHLLEDHGIHPDVMENAIDGTFEGTNNSHVVHMLHIKAHAEGQIQNAHTHDGWTGGTPIHAGHTDVGKPFWGAPPAVAQGSIDHLMASKSEGGHGMSPGKISEHLPHVNPWDPDQAHQEAYDNLHGNLHQHGGDEISHQHVPTAQPNVLSPAKLKKQKLQQHLKDYHGVGKSMHPEMDHGTLHDDSAYGFKGHPGHEHPAWDKHGPVVQSLPSEYGGTESSTLPKHTPQHDHASNMSQGDLATHMIGHSKSGGSDDYFDILDKSHDELLQQHALHHATGDVHEHNHAGVAQGDPLSAQYGHEPEIQTKTHPAIENESEALGHIIKHHPEVTQEAYKTWGTKFKGNQASMTGLHDALHSSEKKYGDLPKAKDGHDHAEPSGPPTQISVGSHLVHEHGMDQTDVAAMSPAEFKAHHEKLHLRHPEFDLGHGHDYPGGPQRDPRTHLPNTHHQLMRENDDHPAVNEWYHGTSADYEGAPKNATELQEGHGFWGNWGGGDWNNHVGTHWTSLHEMAKNFSGKGGSAGNRVIHAKLHMSNPVKYNSLNHMAHDAYDRLRAGGHLQDDGRYEGNHDDDNGYNKCCSDTLLEYSKGHHRSDGKYGLEPLRDSLRASGYDGIHVRNQADAPEGHWNAIPLSADQVEITHGGCRGRHGDERDDDVDEFESNHSKTKSGWEHPKPFNNTAYHGQRLDHLPEDHEIEAAHAAKATVKPRFKTAEGRGDSDPYLHGRSFGAEGEDEEDESEEEYCSHCDEYGDHSSDDCDNKYCNVCEGYGSHTAGEEHPHCTHCDDFADHESEDHEDEYGEHPDHMRKEGFCPHCNISSKENYNSKQCVNCDEKLPNWGQLQAHGAAVGKGEYQKDGETDAVAYGHASGAKLHPNPKDGEEVAAHLYHHHKSNVAGPAFDDEGNWDTDALNYHHQYLHQNPDEAKGKGFEVDHTHKHMFGEFPEKMTPDQTHAHLILAHSNGVEHAKLSTEEAVEQHKKLHDADDAVAWGEKDSAGDLKPKLKHTHNQEPQEKPFDAEYHPKGEDLLAHLGDKSMHSNGIMPTVKKAFEDNPKMAEAMHLILHQNAGPSAEPGIGKYHVHTPELLQDIGHQKQIKSHLIDDHGAKPDHYDLKTATNTADLMKLHHKEHTASFPAFDDPDHTHKGGTAHGDPTGHNASTMVKPEPEGEKKEHIQLASPDVDKWGPNSLMGHAEDHHPDLKDHFENIMDTSMETGQNSPQVGQAIQALHEAHEKIHAPGGPGHPDHYHYDHETKTKPVEGKTASRRTLSDLFEEVAL